MAGLILPDPSPSDYSNWSTVTRASLSLVKDPMKLVARVMVAMSNAQANLLATMTNKVTALTDRMADINELMKNVNDGLAATKGWTVETDHYVLFRSSSEAEADAYRARLIAAGVKESTLSKGFTGSVWQISIAKQNLSAANQNMQLTVDTVSSTTQQAQLSLQTLMGRYNGAFEVVTSAIKKSEAQADAVNINIKK